MNFKILAIEHVAIAVIEAKEPADVFGNLLGIKNTSTEEVVDQKVITDIFDTGAGKIELLKATSNDVPFLLAANVRVVPEHKSLCQKWLVSGQA